jgi:ankyrin repeat protein
MTRGADINYVNSSGMTAFHYAVLHKLREETFVFMIHEGADVTILDK